MLTVVVGIVIVIAAWYVVGRLLPTNTKCNGDCNQGRNCNCKGL